MVIKVAASSILKLFAYKNGALLLVNGSFSAAVVYYLSEMLKGTETKNLVLPITVWIIGVLLYYAFSLVDLFTGLWNAKYQNSILPVPRKNFLKSYKLYRTMWKGLGVTMFTFMAMMVCLFAEIAGGDIAFMAALWFLLTIILMACAFEFHSIGENIEKRTGEKPPFFVLVERLTNVAQKGIILKAKKQFDILEQEPPDDEDNKPINENLNPNTLQNGKSEQTTTE